MAFEIYVVENTPLSDIDDVDMVALRFMENIGYLMKHYDPKTPADSVKKSVPFRMFLECFLKHQDRDWRVDELSKKLKTSVPTIYRHMSKLRALGIMDEEAEEGGKVFHIKHYRFPLAWKITEANVEAALVRYKDIIDFLQGKMKKDKVKDAQVTGAPKAFRLRVKGSRLKLKGEVDDVLPTFLEDVDYLSDQGPGEEDPVKSIPYKLVKDCLLARPGKFWDVDELRTKLRTSRPTIYRHLNKLEAMGLMERKPVGKSIPPKKAHRIRYGSLSKAWNFVEEYTKVAMDNYRLTVNHLDGLIK
jgi:DNA-binding transcriptional ArsR family regulator